jgi:hypothetical protein
MLYLGVPVYTNNAFVLKIFRVLNWIIKLLNWFHDSLDPVSIINNGLCILNKYIEWQNAVTPSNILICFVRIHLKTAVNCLHKLKLVFNKYNSFIISYVYCINCRKMLASNSIARIICLYAELMSVIIASTEGIT